jgi:hypothetical protein
MHSQAQQPTEVPRHERFAERRSNRITFEHIGLAAIIALMTLAMTLGGDRNTVQADHEAIKQLQMQREKEHTLLIRIATKMGIDTNGLE